MLFIRLGFNSGPNGRAVAFRSAAGKNDFLGRRADESGDIFSGSAKFGGDLSAKRMHAGRVPVIGAEIG